MTPTSAYWLLVLLRCLQAGGSASTIALGIYALHLFALKISTYLILGAGVIVI